MQSPQIIWDTSERDNAAFIVQALLGAGQLGLQATRLAHARGQTRRANELDDRRRDEEAALLKKYGHLVSSAPVEFPGEMEFEPGPQGPPPSLPDAGVQDLPAPEISDRMRMAVEALGSHPEGHGAFKTVMGGLSGEAQANRIEQELELGGWSDRSRAMYELALARLAQQQSEGDRKRDAAEGKITGAQLDAEGRVVFADLANKRITPAEATEKIRAILGQAKRAGVGLSKDVREAAAELIGQKAEEGAQATKVQAREAISGLPTDQQVAKISQGLKGAKTAQEAKVFQDMYLEYLPKLDDAKKYDYPFVLGALRRGAFHATKEQLSEDQIIGMVTADPEIAGAVNAYRAVVDMVGPMAKPSAEAEAINRIANNLVVQITSPDSPTWKASIENGGPPLFDHAFSKAEKEKIVRGAEILASKILKKAIQK